MLLEPGFAADVVEDLLFRAELRLFKLEKPFNALPEFKLFRLRGAFMFRGRFRALKFRGRFRFRGGFKLFRLPLEEGLSKEEPLFDDAAGVFALLEADDDVAGPLLALLVKLLDKLYKNGAACNGGSITEEIESETLFGAGVEMELEDGLGDGFCCCLWADLWSKE